MKAIHSGARCSRPKVKGAFTRNSPVASPLRDVISASASSTEASTSLQRAWNTSPSGVSERRRVVRLSRRTPRWASSSATCRDTAALDMGSASEAATKLPASTTATNTRMASSRSICLSIRNSLSH